MKTSPTLIALALVAAGPGARADLILTASQTDNATIPDGDFSGLAETITLPNTIHAISDVQLNLHLTGASAFNGDYYAYLRHGSGFCVLLNRVGVTAANPYGAGESGLAVTFRDTGPDIHGYASGSYALNGSGELTGTWAPDGRTANPLTVLDTDARNALLGTFNGGSSGGLWTLFLADVSPGGEGQLASWSLQVTQSAVPDGGNSGWLLLLGGLPLLFARQHGKRPQT